MTNTLPPTYREFPEIVRPACLAPELGWVDNSWHNDAFPHSDKRLPNGRYLEVWVAEDDPAMRELPIKKYMVVVVSEDYEPVLGIPELEVESEDDLIAAINHYTNAYGQDAREI